MKKKTDSDSNINIWDQSGRFRKGWICGDFNDNLNKMLIKQFLLNNKVRFAHLLIIVLK